MCIQGSDMLKVLLRSDSAPVYIPTSRLGDVPISCNKTILPFSPPNNGTRRTLSLLDRSSTTLPGSPNARKLLAFREEEIAKPSGVKILSSSSPHRSFSRSFSRLSYEGSYDDSEFSGPFVVDDVIYHGSRKSWHALPTNTKKTAGCCSRCSHSDAKEKHQLFDKT